MRQLMFKLAGVSSDKEFYLKFPTEESFMTKHGNEFKKAQGGITLPKEKTYFDRPKPTLDIERWNSKNLPTGVQGVQDYPEPEPFESQWSKIESGISKYAPVAGKLVQGFQQLKDEKRLLDSANQMKGVSDVMLRASNTRPEVVERDWIRPEDTINTGEELFPIYGQGSEVARKGTTVKGKKAQWGDFSMKAFAGAGGEQAISNIITGIGGENAGGNIGGTIGSTLGGLVGGPVGGLIGQGVGQIAGALIDRRPAQIKKARKATMNNINQMGFNDNINDLQDQNFSYMDHGGTIPQMEQNGELQLLWGGDVETISKNPYSNSETVKFTGQSHDTSKDGKSGIGITFDGNPVEVEGNEPAMKTIQGGQEGLTIFGNLKIPKGGDDFIGDDKAKGMKFKNYIDMLSKKEDKFSKMQESNVTDAGDLEVITSTDKITLNSHKANSIGADMNLKIIAQKKEKTALLQNAINSAMENNGTAQDGKFVTGYDENNMELIVPEAYDYLVDLYNKAAGAKTGPAVEFFQKEFHRISPNRAKTILEKYPVTNFGKGKGLTNDNMVSNEDSIFGYRTEQYAPGQERRDPSLKLNELGKDPVSPYGKTDIKDPGYKRSALLDAFGMVMPFIRPTDAEQLDPNQLTGEMYALSQNQLEPVQAQTYSPQLDTPYRVSLQDIQNENVGDFRAVTRSLGYNPAAQSALASGKYEANQKVLGEEFRMNQAMQDKVYSENRATLNDAELKNLGIYDKQYERQVGAKANTKATTLEALKSISDKIAKNKFENRTLQVYENLYNYRYDNSGRAINLNDPYQFNIPTVGNLPTVDTEGNRVVTETERKSQRKDKYGIPQGTIESKEKRETKKASNGMLLKSLKNI